MCLDKKKIPAGLQRYKEQLILVKKIFTFGLSVVFLISNNPMKICGVKIHGLILK